MGIDIHSGIQTAFFLLLVSVFILIVLAFKSIRKGNHLYYHQKRKELIKKGWGMLGLAIIVGAFAAFVNQFGEPYVYRVFPPTPTITLTSTITLTPTITLSPTITQTPTITETPSITPFPTIPSIIVEEFKSEITPNPRAVFGPITFAVKLNADLQPVDQAVSFRVPVTHLYGAFSYDNLEPGVQWTAVWIYDDQLFCYETIPWNGATGGYGFTDCQKDSDQWLPGRYVVHIYIGLEYMISGSFDIIGDVPTLTALTTHIPSLSYSATPTATPSQ